MHNHSRWSRPQCNRHIAIKLPSREIQKIEHVLYSPSIVKNFLSVGFLASRGLSLELREQNCTIRNLKGDLITTIEREHNSRLYKLKSETMRNCSETLIAQVDKTESLSTLWHQRLGHTHYQNMPCMIQYEAVSGMPQMTVGNISYEICALGKQTRTKIPQRTSSTSEILQLVHSDVCGPLRTRSLRGARYFLTFTDDFSKMTFVYFLSCKRETFDKFLHFHHEVERQTNKKLLVLRTDNGGEFSSKEFQEYCNTMESEDNSRNHIPLIKTVWLSARTCHS